MVNQKASDWLRHPTGLDDALLHGTRRLLSDDLVLHHLAKEHLIEPLETHHEPSETHAHIYIYYVVVYICSRVPC